MYIQFFSLNTIRFIGLGFFVVVFILFCWFSLDKEKPISGSQQTESFKGTEETALSIFHICFFQIMCFNDFSKHTYYLCYSVIRQEEDDWQQSFKVIWKRMGHTEKDQISDKISISIFFPLHFSSPTPNSSYSPPSKK